MSNQYVVISITLYFILLVLKQVNAVTNVTISIIRVPSVPDIIKKLNVKVFNLMSRTNETRHIEWHETCRCICRLDAIVCSNKQRWNNDKCQCKCKELIDKSVCDKGYVGILLIMSGNVIKLVILVNI